MKMVDFSFSINGSNLRCNLTPSLSTLLKTLVWLFAHYLELLFVGIKFYVKFILAIKEWAKLTHILIFNNSILVNHAKAALKVGTLEFL